MCFKDVKGLPVVLILLFLLHFNPAFSQRQNPEKAIKLQKLAINHYLQFDTLNAIEFSRKAIKFDTSYATPWVMLGNIYSEQNKTDIAIQYLRRALKLDKDEFPDLIFTLSELELKNQEFDIVISRLEEYLSISQDEVRKENALRILELAKFRKEAYLNPHNISLKELNGSINSKADEYINFVNFKDEKLYLTIKKFIGKDQMGNQFFNENIFYSDKDEDGWNNPIPIQITPGLDADIGSVNISPNQQYLFFTVCNKDGEGGCNLFYAKIKDGAASQARSLGGIVNSKSWDAQPCFSSDGKRMFFTSKRAGGFGGSDIWITSLNKEGRFQKPVNARENINTAKNEMAPFIHPDNKTLYFSSDGHLGMGGYDLFMSKWSDSAWSEPKNLGIPINTHEDEINLFVAKDASTAFISSKKKGGKGGFDIYSFVMPQDVNPTKVIELEGVVFDSETGERLVAQISTIDLNDGSEFSFNQSNNEGEFIVNVVKNKPVLLNASKEGYLFYEKELNNLSSKEENSILEIPMQRIEVGAKIILEHIYFDYDKYELKDESIAQLERVLTFLEKNKNLKIEISGHTDDIGGEKYNQELSEKRAQYVVNYLRNNRKDLGVLIAKGYGSSLPIVENTSDLNRAKNRRVEFKILSK